MLTELGHHVTVADAAPDDCQAYNLLIALHAMRSEPSARRFREARPGQPVFVVLTGTDLHRDLGHSTAAQENETCCTKRDTARTFSFNNSALLRLKRFAKRSRRDDYERRVITCWLSGCHRCKR